jgi:Rap1a immunity proteins
MQSKWAISAFMFAALVSSPVWGEGTGQQTVSIYVSGTKLTQWCRSFMITHPLGRGTNEQVQEAAWCYGYVTGVFDLVAELTVQGRITPPFCIPKGTDSDDLTEIVATFLDKNPARRNHSGADLVGTAWSESFPCPSR